MAFEATRLFLYRVLPWHPVGRPDAYVNVHWTFKGPAYDRAAWSGRACISIDECINSIQWAQRQADTRDFYVCLSTQREYEERKTKNGRTMRIARRSQENACQLRALYIDVDVKSGDHHADGYEDITEAATTSLDFFKRAGLPRPTLYVKTGSGGLHFYWCISEALDVATWQPLANALAEATRRFRLRADTAVTVDSARVMRLPGTKHFRAGKMAEMDINQVLPHDYSVEQMRAALAPYMGAQVITLTPRGKITGPNADLVAGIEQPKAQPINIDTVAQAGCGFIAEALKTGGANYGNPLWNLTTLTSVFTEGGHVDAHRMASGWPGYSPHETEELFQRKEREHTEKNLGWPSCQSVENAGCVSCRTCPLKGPSTRPLQFGRPTQVPVQAPPLPVDPELPHGYSRDSSGFITRIITKPDGTSYPERVVNKPILQGWMQEEPEWAIHFRTRLSGGSDERQLCIPMEVSNTTDGFAAYVGKLGIPLSANEKKEFREFIVAWQTKLQQLKEGVITSQPFGWSEHNGKINGFAYGGYVWQRGTSKPAANPDAQILKYFTPKGELQPWLDAAKMITDLRTPERDTFIAAAFAAPLVHIANFRGAVVSAFSESGYFKSASMIVGLSVWGHPQATKQELNDTQNSVFRRIGTLAALPVFWDEIKSEEDHVQFANLVFRMSGGKERSRMNSDGGLQTQGLWKTLLMSASNNSILDHVLRANKATSAGILRVFEYEIPKVDSPKSATSADALTAALDNNFGQAGLVYSKFLGENYERISQEVVDCRERFEVKFKLEKEERLWGGMMAVLFMGARYANEIGLTQIDLQAMLGFLARTLTRMRGEIRSRPISLTDKAAISNVLQQYLGETQARHMLKTDRIHINRGKPAANSVKIIGATDKLDGIWIHVAKDSKIMRLAATPFREWCHTKGYTAHAMINAMAREFNVKPAAQGRLGGGTPFVSMIEYVLDLDLTNKELAKLIEFDF
jgi:hypothetical protein